MDVKAAPNGVATIEDRILRITGYYGYYPGYSSQKRKIHCNICRIIILFGYLKLYLSMIYMK